MKKINFRYASAFLFSVILMSNFYLDNNQQSAHQNISSEIATMRFDPTVWILNKIQSAKSSKPTKEEAKLSIEDQIISLHTFEAAYRIATCEEEPLYKARIATIKKELSDIIQEKSLGQFSQFMMPSSTCPEIQVMELSGIPGFSKTNELVICGAPDTLAFLIFIEEPGNISGTQMTAKLLPGMQYARFETTHYNTTTIANLDPNPNQPKFLLEGITDGVYVAYIGIEATCDADINAFNYEVDLDFSFIYEDTLGNFQSCRQSTTPNRSYNAILKEPVLNFRSVPITNITTLEQEFCTNITLSQDGIQAYLEEVEFSVCNVDFATEIELTSVSANGTAIPYTYSPVDSTLNVNVSGSYFQGNSVPNPSDDRFDESEQLTIQLCMKANECPSINTQFITYKAAYSCNGETCQITNRNSEIRVRPTTSPTPIASSVLVQQPGVCGNPAIIELTLQSSVADSTTGLFTDLTFGFETCEKSALDISKVTIGGTEIAAQNYQWIGTDLAIDLSTMTSDPDGAGGITDIDGDGFFDDLPGGSILNIRVELDFSCAFPDDPTTLACSSLDCSFGQFHVSARRDCGQLFTFEPPVEDFSITNGATYVGFNNQDEISTTLIGYDFGPTRTTGANCSPLAAKIKTVEFCYVYERENIEPCAAENTTNELQVLFDGTPRLVHDVEFVAGSGEMTVNGVTTQTGVTGIFTDLSPSTRLLNLPIGELNIGDTICYIYQLAADSASCSPPVYMNGTHQVIETCMTDGCTCKTVKACDVVLFRSDPSNCDCICDISSGANIKRWNLGYTDESMTEKIKEADVPVADLTRFLPCDTMYYEGWMTFNTPESVGELYQWFFIANITDIGGNGWTGNDDTELMIDAAGTELLGLDFSANGGGGVRAPIDVSSLSDCLDNPNTGGSTGFFAYAGKTPWSDVTFNTPMCSSGFEYHDGNLFGVYFRNFDRLEDCREIETASWEEGNCLDQLKEAFNIQIGDTIYMKWLLPLTKNVKTAGNLIADPAHTISAPQMINVASGSYIDPFDSDCLANLSNCRENTPFQTFCPKDLNAVTDITTDDCGGSVSHKFNVVTSTPVNWFTQEYRPFFKIEDIDIPFYSPFMYCGEAKLISKSGKEYPLSIQSMQDHTCATVNGQEYCSVSSGSTGILTFNPETDGFPGLGVGLGGFIDEFEIVYDLCRVCPSDPVDFSTYELTYDYRTCETPNNACFRCNQTITDTSNELPKICGINGSALVDRLGFYYDELNLDTLFRKDNVTSGDVTTSDMSNGFPALSQLQDRNLLTSGSPGISEEINTIEICADSADSSSETHRGVLSSITMTNSVAFVSAYDANMNPLAFDTVSSSATSNTYAVFLPDLAPGECTTLKIGTTLLFCPTPPDRPEICITTTSGCMDPSIMAALAGSTTACNSIETCYEYVFEEAGLQADFLLPEAGTSYALCDTIPMAVLVKNVKTTTLTDITMDINLPIVGATIVPGSFEASYPNSGNFNLPFYSISDPILSGNNLLYPEDAVFSQAIHTNGLPGVTSAADSNFVVVRFLLITTCDEYVSGSQANFEATAADPCSPNTLSSGLVNSPRIIIDNANPEDFGQVLVTAKPSEAYCGSETPTFVVTGQNISEKPLGDSVQMCVTLPPSLIYRTGSMRYIIPNSLSLGMETITMINGQTQVCFQGYENMPVGGAFTLNFEADFATDTECGDYEIGTDIKNLIEDEFCVSGADCDVFVQSTVNPTFNLTLKGPLETVDLQLYRRCTDTNDPVTVCYDVTLTNPGPDYTGDIAVNLHDDILANQTLEFYDPILGNDVYASTFIASGDSITLSGCFTMDAINSCPVILDMVYESPCACDHDATPFTTLEPEFMAEFPQTTVLCPEEELGLATCGDYQLTYDPASNMVERVVGDSVYLSIVDPSILTQIFYTGTTGECSVSGVRSIRGLETFDFELTAMTCEGQDAILQLDIPSEYESIITTQWLPATNLDDPTRTDPVFNSSIPGTYQYEVTLTFGEGCVLKDSVFVEVKPIGEINIAGNSTICYLFETNILTADPGFDFYEWYLVEGGFEIIKASTATEVWTGPTEPGKYIVKAFRSTDMCPSISDPIMITQANCIDLELEKTICEIADIPHLGDTIAYQITVCNRRVVDSLLIHDANMVMVNESLPAGVLYVSNTTTQGTYTPASGQWDIGTLPSGACETLKLQVQIIATGKQKNTAEITNSDKEDIDSEEDNDDGDQSEDDEDMAMFTIPACTASNTGPYCTYETIVLNETGGDATSWSWTGPAAFSSTDQMPTTTPPVAGIYTLLVTDIDGNQTTCSTEVIVHPELTMTGVITDPTCNGFTDGRIDITVIGGTSPFTFDWSDDGAEMPDNDTQNLLNIGAGDYSVTVTDAVGCTVAQDFTIGEPAILTCTIAQTNILCNGESTGDITVTGTGGTAPYEYSLNGGTWQPGNLFTNLPAGNYTVSIRDKNSCISTCTATLTEPNLLTCATSVTNVTDCNIVDGTITVTGTGGNGQYEYSLDGGAYQTNNVFTGVMAGTHVIMIRDENNCLSECSAVLTAPEVPMCTIGQIVNINCMGDATGSFVVSASGGSGDYEFSLDNITFQSSNSFTNLTAGMHTVYTRNRTSPMCVSMCSVNLTEPPLLSCTLNGNNISCFGGSDGNITVNASGGVMPFEYSLDGGAWQTSPAYMDLTIGTYVVNVRDANQCISACTITLTEPTALTCSLDKTEPLCFGGTGTIRVNGTGGVTPHEYQLNGGAWQSANTFNSLLIGDYAVTIRDANNCISTCEVSIMEPSLLSCSTTVTNVTDCGIEDGTITVMGVGGTGVYSYSLNGGAFQSTNLFTNVSAGTHAIQIQDANNCMSECEAILTIPSPPICEIINVVNIACMGDATGSFTVQATGGTGGYEYSIDNITFQSSPNFTGLIIGTYTAYTRNRTSPMCITTCMITLTEPSLLTCSLTGKNISCFGGTDGNIQVSSMGGVAPYQYSLDGSVWQNNPLFENLSIGTYSIATRDANNCIIDCTITLTEPPLLTCDLSTIEPLCTGGEGSIIASSQGGITPHEYSIDGLTWQSNTRFDNLLAGNYTISVRDAQDCISTCAVLLNEPLPLMCTIEKVLPETCVDNSGRIEISSIGGTAPIRYSIDNGITFQSSGLFTGLGFGFYEILVVDDHGCMTTCSTEVPPTCFDLALNKTTTDEGPFKYGDSITFDFTVYNQGNITATNIEVTEFMPCGYEFIPSLNPQWIQGSGNTATTLITDTIAEGEFTSVPISFVIQACTESDAWKNTGEISGSEDQFGTDTTKDDTDSDADDDPNNDGDMTDNVVDNENGDEDDSDFEVIEVFDLAQIKQAVTPGPYTYGSTIEYAITVYNQGNVPATNIQITDYIPAGLVFDPVINSTWTGTAPLVNTSIPETLLPGDSTVVFLQLTLVKDDNGNADYTNISEISAAQDTTGMTPVDADSAPDNDPENDGDPENDDIDNANGDEDDHDPHTVEVFDLALIKKLTDNQRANVFRSNTVAYQLNVYNQGNVTAYNIQLTDYIPNGLLFSTAANTSLLTGNANDWALQNPNAVYTIDSLAALDSISIFMNFRVDPTFRGEFILNFAEISFASNSKTGANTTDADSTADKDDTNDNGADPENDNNISGDGTIDEDDHDPEVIYIFSSDDIVIIGDTTTAQEPDTLIIADDIDPEATPAFPPPIEEEYNCDLPTYCHHGLAIELMPVGMVQIWASDISVNDFGPCPATQLALWHPSLGIKMPTQLADIQALPSQLVFTCEHLGDQDVQLYIIDEAGNWNFCSTFINVQDNNKGCQENSTREEDMAILGGQINTWKGDAVEEVLVNTIGTSYMTKTDGFYHFELPMKEDYTVTPIKTDNPLNGVSTYDLVLMTKHILGVQPFDNPYQWIAADVNNSQTVTTFDIVQLRKLILAIDKQFLNNTSWRFMAADHTLERANPLLNSFPEISSVSSLNGDTCLLYTSPSPRD